MIELSNQAQKTQKCRQDRKEISKNPILDAFSFSALPNFRSSELPHFPYYASTMGRFLKPDNIIPNAANPQSWNLYSYVNGNPVNFNDPSGHAMGSRPQFAYMEATHSFGMSWFDQFSWHSPDWSPWPGQTADNSWYFGTTKEAFHNYVWTQYVSSTWNQFVGTASLSSNSQLGEGCNVVSIINLLLGLGVPAEQVFSVTKQLIEKANSVGGVSEAPVAIACQGGVVEVKLGDIVKGSSTSLAAQVELANHLIREGWQILALGHVHGTALFPWPSGSQYINLYDQAGDTYGAEVFLTTLPDKHSRYFENRLIVLTNGFLFLYNRGAWDIAPLR
jgi:hypothetical protein